jgi:hypothetical protein
MNSFQFIRSARLGLAHQSSQRKSKTGTGLSWLCILRDLCG